MDDPKAAIASAEERPYVLLPDPHMPALGLAWSDEGLATLFGHRALRALWAGRVLSYLEATKVTYVPGRWCAILCALGLDGPEADGPSWALVTFAKERRAEGVFRRHYADQAGLAAPPPAVFLAEYECLVERFPMDWRLPSLPDATDPGRIGALLPMAGGHPAVRPLAYRPHERCVLLYEGPQAAVGKIYSQRSMAAQAWGVLTGAGREVHGVHFPEGFRLVPAWSLVLMERVRGTSMKEVVRGAGTGDHARTAVGLSAGALASLHALRVPEGQVRTLGSELERLRKKVSRVRLVAPQLADDVDGLLDRVAELSAGVSLPEPAFIHGDFKLSQLLLDGSQVSVVDVDRASAGDPALDVGNMMAELRKEGRRAARRTGPRYPDGLAADFLATYEERSGRNGLARRAQLFQALALVRIGLRIFLRAPHAYARRGAASRPARLLEEAAGCLAELEP